jgi:N-acetylneuraminic acid mutarotase
LANAPSVGAEVASAVVGGRLYIAGGYGASGVVKTVYAYDPVANRWSRAPDLPVALHHPMGAAFKGRFVVAGGFRATGYATASARVFTLQATGWKPLPNLRHARGAGGAVAIGRSLYVVGGTNGNKEVAPTERFEGTKWVDLAPLPLPRDHLAVVSDGRGIYAVCGRVGSLSANKDQIDRFDPSTGRWATLPAAPTARGGIGAGVVSGGIIVVGGEGPRETAGPDGVFKQVERFDLDQQRWITLTTSMPRPRHGVGVGVIGSSLYVALGGRLAGLAPTAYLDVFERSE